MSVAEPRVRYATTGNGIKIAYWAVGEGPTLLMTPYHGYSHIGLDWHHPVNRAIYERLASRCTLVRFDGRGTGLSQRDVVDVSIEARVHDIAAVAAATADGSLSVLSLGYWGGAAVRFAAENPALVSRLLIYDSFISGSEIASQPNQIAVDATIKALSNVDMVHTARVMATMLGADPDWWAVYWKAAITSEALALAKPFLANDCAAWLERVTCQCLVFQEEWPDDDSRFSARLAAALPDAQLVSVKRTHQDQWWDMADISSSVYEFIGLQPPVSPPSAGDAPAASTFRTVLFTDLVGHTEMMQRLGDERGRDVLREHERITREVLKANGGTEVKTMGDGFMASFGSVTKAVECAVALQRAFADREGEPLSVRVGLNAGEPIEEDGDLFGATVILASRIAARADAGEILVAGTVRGLCSGKGFLFADRGEFVAKGFEEPVRVYEVSWRE
jgi:class 3 adenylate cyclase/pimeloyl-ACP methyl ester carboxylesterase